MSNAEKDDIDHRHMSLSTIVSSLEESTTLRMVPSQRSVWHIFLFNRLRKDEDAPKLLRFWVDALKGSWKEDRLRHDYLLRPSNTDMTFYALYKKSPEKLCLSPESSQYIEKNEHIFNQIFEPPAKTDFDNEVESHLVQTLACYQHFKPSKSNKIEHMDPREYVSQRYRYVIYSLLTWRHTLEPDWVLKENCAYLDVWFRLGYVAVQ